MVIFTGPFQAFDEPNHFYRIYQIADGHLLAKRIGDRAGGRLPQDVHSAVVSFPPLALKSSIRVDTGNLKAQFEKPPASGKKVFVEFPNTAINIPLVYAPHVLGMAVGKLFRLSPLELMYVARVFGLLCWITLVWAAIRTIPVLKPALTLLALMPGPLFVAASLSADTVINAVSILLVAMVVRATIGKTESFGRLELTIIAGLCILLSMAKLVYIPLVGLIVLIPGKRFGDSKEKIVYCTAVTAASLGAAVLWAVETRNVYVTYDPFRYGIDAGAQVKTIMEYPWQYTMTLLSTIGEQWRRWMWMFTGVTSNGLIKLPSWVHTTYPWLLLSIAFLDAWHANALKALSRTWLALLCFAVLLLVVTALYITWNTPGATVIQGVQGRYMVPILLPILLLPHIRLSHFKRLPLGWFVTTYSAVVLTTVCFKLYTRYYG